MNWDNLVTALIWLFAYVGVIALITFACGQIMRQEARKIFQNKQRLDQLQKKLEMAPACFGGGEVLKSSGQAKFTCPKCVYLSGCINVSERLRKTA